MEWEDVGSHTRGGLIGGWKHFQIQMNLLQYQHQVRQQILVIYTNTGAIQNNSASNSIRGVYHNARTAPVSRLKMLLNL